MRNHLLTHTALAFGLIGAALIVSPAHAAALTLGGGAHTIGGTSVGHNTTINTHGTGLNLNTGTSANIGTNDDSDSARINTQNSGESNTRINDSQSADSLSDDTAVNLSADDALQNQDLLNANVNGAVGTTMPTVIHGTAATTNTLNTTATTGSTLLRNDSNGLRSDRAIINSGISPASGLGVNSNTQGAVSGSVKNRAAAATGTANTVRTNTGTTAVGTARVSGGTGISTGTSTSGNSGM